MLFCEAAPEPDAARARDAASTRARRWRCRASKAILTVDDLPGAQAGAELGENVTRTAHHRARLTKEPMYEGEPILAVAAVDELTAAEAIEKIQIEFEPLPFAVDPIASLRPGSANARTQGNVWMRPPAPPAGCRWRRAGRGAPAPPPRPEVQRAEVDRGRLRRGARRPDAAGQAHRRVDVRRRRGRLQGRGARARRTFVGQNTSHQVLEPRSAMAYWQNGKLYPARRHAEHGADRRRRSRAGSASTQKDVVLISEYTGGGFGSRIPGYIAMAIPALLSKKANAPVMMRITREDEHYIGRARPALHSRVKVGFDKDGRITAHRPVRASSRTVRTIRWATAGRPATSSRWPISRRRCGGAALAVLTNTPPRGAQRAPGGMQGIAIMEPILAKAARKLGIDEVDDPQDQRAGRQGAVRRARTRAASVSYVTSAFVKEALDKGAELFNWEEKKARSGKRDRHEGARRPAWRSARTRPARSASTAC